MRQTKVFFTMLMILGATILMHGMTPAQQMMKIDLGDGEVFFLQDIGCLIKMDGEQLVVDFVMPADTRSKEYRELDFQKGDVVAMMNGKGLKSIKDIEEKYASIAEGEPVKMGIKRGRDMMMMAFDKPAAGSVQPGQKIIIATPGDATEGSSGFPLMGLGIFIDEAKDKVVVSDVMYEVPALEEGLNFEKDDIITEMNGAPVTSAKNLFEEYQNLKPGDKTAFEGVRADKPFSITFEKPEIKARSVIKEN
ncbi:MAG: PDZ domain-containing protein [Candidatus Zixiibacteriota bacterium]